MILACFEKSYAFVWLEFFLTLICLLKIELMILCWPVNILNLLSYVFFFGTDHHYCDVSHFHKKNFN